MPRAIADTSLFIAVEQGRLDEWPNDLDLALSIVTIGELQAGVFAAVARGALSETSTRLHTLALAQALMPVPITEGVAEVWGRLFVELRAAGRRLPANDSWIAATAIHEGVALATQDDDFDDVPGLAVIKVG